MPMARWHQGASRESHISLSELKGYRMTNGSLSMNIVKMTDTCRNESLQNLLHAGLPMPYGQMCAKAPESVQGGQWALNLRPVKQEQQKTLKTRGSWDTPRIYPRLFGWEIRMKRFR